MKSIVKDLCPPIFWNSLLSLKGNRSINGGGLPIRERFYAI